MNEIVARFLFVIEKNCCYLSDDHITGGNAFFCQKQDNIYIYISTNLYVHV